MAAFTHTGEWAAGDFSQLFTHHKAVIENETIISTDIELLMKHLTEEEFNLGADNYYGIVRRTHGSSGRYALGGPIAQAAVFSRYNAPEYEKFSFHLKAWVKTFSLTGQKMMRCNTPGTHLEIFKEMIDASNTADAKSKGAKLFGNGSGALGHITTANTYTSASDIPIKQWQAVIKSKTYAADYAGARYLYPGCSIVIGTAAELAANAPKCWLIVNSVSSENQTFRYKSSVGPASVTLAQNDIVVAGDDRGNEYNVAITGLDTAINNTGTYMGLNRATAGNGFWQSIIKTNSGSLMPMTSSIIYRDLKTLAKAATGVKTKAIGGSTKIIAHDSLAFETLFAPEKIYVETQKLKPRFGPEQELDTLMFSYGATKIPIYFFEDAPLNEYQIWRDTPQIWNSNGFWVPATADNPNSIWKQSSTGNFSYEAEYYMEHELVIDRPSMYLRREDLAVPTANITTEFQA